MSAPTPFARQLRYWRRARGFSQLELASRARSTPRYVSFMENGRSRPGEQMVHRLADALDIPIRERNELLEAAGFSPSYPALELAAPPMQPYCLAVTHILRVHEPFPAFAVNRWWDVVEANQAAQRFLTEIDPTPPKNMIEWFFAPDSGARKRFDRWSNVAHVYVTRIRRELVAAPNDERLARLATFAERELANTDPPEFHPESEIVVCPSVRLDTGTVSVIGMVSRFGAAREATLDELRVECLYPRDEASERYFRDAAGAPSLSIAK